MKSIAIALLLAATLCVSSDAQSGRWNRSNDDEGIFSRTVIHPDETRTLDKRDLNSKLLEKRTFDKNGVLLMKSIFQLNASGKAINGLVYDGRNALLYRSEFVYDNASRLREERIFEPNGSPVRRLIYKPDPRTGEMKPAFAHSYVGGKEVSSSNLADLDRFSTNSPHAYRGGVANTPGAYKRPAQQSKGSTRSSNSKRDRRFRIFKRK